MTNRSPRLVSRLRIFVPLAVLVLILAGATAAFASGAFESHTSGFDSPRDSVERGTIPEPSTTTSPADTADDKGVDPPVTPAAPATPGNATAAPAIHDAEPNDVNDDNVADVDDDESPDVSDDKSGSVSTPDDSSGRGRGSEHGGTGHPSDD